MDKDFLRQRVEEALMSERGREGGKPLDASRLAALVRNLENELKHTDPRSWGSGELGAFIGSVARDANQRELKLARPKSIEDVKLSEAEGLGISRSAEEIAAKAGYTREHPHQRDVMRLIEEELYERALDAKIRKFFPKHPVRKPLNVRIPKSGNAAEFFSRQQTSQEPEAQRPISLEVAFTEDARTKEFLASFFPARAGQLWGQYRKIFREALVEDGMSGKAAHFKALYDVLPTKELKEELARVAAKHNFDFKALGKITGGATIEEFTAGGRVPVIEGMIVDKMKATMKLKELPDGAKRANRFWELFQKLFQPHVNEASAVATAMYAVWPEARADIEAAANKMSARVMHEKLKPKAPAGGGGGSGKAQLRNASEEPMWRGRRRGRRPR